MKLRDYQSYGIGTIFEYFQSGKTGNPIVAMPTGTGKSLLIGGFIKQAMEMYPNTRIMKLTHVKELLEQNLDKLLRLWPNAPAGLYSSGLKKKELGYPILFGGIGTVARALPEQFGRIDLLLIDECHLLSPKDTTMYQIVISELKKINPALKVIGFTATPYRLGHGMLTEPGGLFTDICFDMTTMASFNWLIAEGYLSPPIPKRTGTELDLSGVHIHGGEYKQNELQSAVDKAEITYSALQELIQHGEDRDHWLIFASGIEHAEHIATMLNELKIPTTHVHSKMGDAQRDANISDFKTGKYRAMVNNGILTTGFDFPEIDLIGMLRPTQSTSLWCQMLGRGTRPVYMPGFDLDTKEGRLAAIAAGPKQNCLVLDFARNTLRLGPINDPVLPKRKGKGGGMAPVRICEVCGTYNHASVRFCISCGQEFPRILKIGDQASTEALLVAEKKPDPVFAIFKVDSITYHEHRKENRPPSLVVTYQCGLRSFKEWVCLEHGGFAGKKARDFWRKSAGTEPPDTIAEAITRLPELHIPTGIQVEIKQKYDEVVYHFYNGENTNV